MSLILNVAFVNKARSPLMTSAKPASIFQSGSTPSHVVKDVWRSLKWFLERRLTSFPVKKNFFASVPLTLNSFAASDFMSKVVL